MQGRATVRPLLSSPFEPLSRMKPVEEEPLLGLLARKPILDDGTDFG